MDNKTEVPESLFQRHGIGIVLDNKLLSQKVITFTIPEHTPMISGEAIPDIKRMDVEYVDIRGNTQTISTQTTIAEEATWMPGTGWFDTAPDVRRGELVIIWRYGKPGNKPIYFWESMGLKRHLRRKETMRISISGSEKEGELTPENSYTLELSGHTNSVLLRTGKSNGEVAQWSFSMLGNEGIASLSNIINGESADDRNGISLSLDAVRDRIFARNEYGCFVDIEKENGQLFIEGDYTETINGNKITQIKGNHIVTIEGNEETTINGNRNHTIQGNDVVTINGAYTASISMDSTIIVNGTSVSTSMGETSLTAPAINLNGSLWFNGPIGQKADLAGDLSAKLRGPLDVEQNVSAADLGTPIAPSYNVHFHHYDGSKPTSNPKG